MARPKKAAQECIRALPRSAAVSETNRSTVGIERGHQIRVRSWLFTLLRLACSTVALRSGWKFAGQCLRMRPDKSASRYPVVRLFQLFQALPETGVTCVLRFIERRPRIIRIMPATIRTMLSVKKK